MFDIFCCFRWAFAAVCRTDNFAPILALCDGIVVIRFTIMNGKVSLVRRYDQTHQRFSSMFWYFHPSTSASNLW